MERNGAAHRLCLLSALFVCVLLLTCNSPGEFDTSELAARTVRFSLMGGGDPQPHFPPAFSALTLALHEGIDGSKLTEALGVSPGDLAIELQQLENQGLVRRGPDGYRPDFFVADQRDSRVARRHAESAGRVLAEEALERWDLLGTVFDSLALSTAYSLQDLGFFLVGERILDSGLFGALAEDWQILAPPTIPSDPGSTGTGHFLWAVEGSRDDIGHYDRKSIELPRGPWRLVTFGLIPLGNASEGPREAMERRARDLVRTRNDGTPLLFSQVLSIPILTERDSRLWGEVSDSLTSILLRRLHEHGPDLPGLFSTLRAGEYEEPTGQVFAGFVVWYHRLTVAAAVDELVRKNAIRAPDSGFQAVILHADEKAEEPGIPQTGPRTHRAPPVRLPASW